METRAITKQYFVIKEKRIGWSIDDERGFDHGLFIPLKLMYPEADIPAIQISLVRWLEPVVHIEMGKALNELMLWIALEAV